MKGLIIAAPPRSEWYPIDSIYISIDTINPGDIFGGIWERILDKFLLCSGDIYQTNTTGGNATHSHATANHTLTVNEIPSHNHILTRLQWFSADVVVSSSTGSIYSWKSGLGTGGSTSYSYKSSGTDISYTGNGQAHNHGDTTSASNIPPYLAVTVWKRVG